jgi:hypothetical protein
VLLVQAVEVQLLVVRHTLVDWLPVAEDLAELLHQVVLLEYLAVAVVEQVMQEEFHFMVDLLVLVELAVPEEIQEQQE